MEIKSVKKVNGTNPRDESTILACYEVKFHNVSNVICVPPDSENTDYQAIQKWVEEGNTIEEAD
jgi:hypothetical protein